MLVDLVSIVTINGRSFCPLTASHHRALWGGYYVCICSGQRSASAPPFHMSFHGNLWAAWHHPTACFMTSSAAALPYVKSCVFSVFLMYVMSGIGDIFENVCWWCIYQEVHFLIVDNNCWCFPQNLVKRTRCWGASPVAGSSNHHEDNSELKEWWRIPDPHFVYLCPMVPPVPHFVWVASLSVNLNGITDYDQILDLTL